MWHTVSLCTTVEAAMLLSVDIHSERDNGFKYVNEISQARPEDSLKTHLI